VGAVRKWTLGSAKSLRPPNGLKVDQLTFDHRWPPSLPSPSGGRGKSPNPNPTPKPFCMRRGAQGQTDQGSSLSERSEFARYPGWTEHRRLSYWGQTPISLRCEAPHPSGRAIGSANLDSDPKNSADSRVAFSLVTFFWRGVCQGSCRLSSFSGRPFWNRFFLPFRIEIDRFLKLPVS
jgi:hypothetical protein